jgi:hypothetical protein
MNQLDCSTAQQLIEKVSLVDGCDIVQDGSIRLLTPFMYPNGSHIDLFLKNKEPLLEEIVLTDMGQTTSYLLDVQVKPWATNRRRQIIEDICRSLDVGWNGGQFEIPFNLQDPGNLSQQMMRLAQACIRVSDLAFSARLWSAGSFKEEMEEFFESAVHRQYETDVVEPGKSGDGVKIDFRIFGETTVSLILTLSAASSVSGHNSANEALSRWFDLGRKKPNQQRITVLDESHDVFRDGDLKRVGSLSTIIAFPTEQEQLRSAVIS